MRWFEIIAEEEREKSLLKQIDKIRPVVLHKDETLSQKEQLSLLLDDVIVNIRLIKQLSDLLRQVLDKDQAYNIKRDLTPAIKSLINQLTEINKTLLTESKIYKTEYDAIASKIKNFIKILNEFIGFMESIKGYYQLKKNLNEFLLNLNNTVKCIEVYQQTDF